MLREEAAAGRWAVSSHIRARWMDTEAGHQHRPGLSWWLVKETRIRREGRHRVYVRLSS